MSLVQEREKLFKREVKIFWEEIQNKLNISYSELNELYKENKKYEINNHNYNSDFNNNNIIKKNNIGNNSNLSNERIINNNNNNNEFLEYVNNQYDNKNNIAFSESLDLNNPNMGSMKSKVYKYLF